MNGNNEEGVETKKEEERKKEKKRTNPDACSDCPKVFARYIPVFLLCSLSLLVFSLLLPLLFLLPLPAPTTCFCLSFISLASLFNLLRSGGKICLTDHFKPLWARNVPRFGIAHAMALGVSLRGQQELKKKKERKGGRTRVGKTGTSSGHILLSFLASCSCPQDRK